MAKGMGYPLPAGDASEDDLECCIVFYPARDEYRRALMGSLDYLATWIAWERDSEKRGQDAAASWKLANIQTWECTNMGYCQDLMTTLEALLAATTALECCGDQDITDGKQFTDEIVDGEGDVPQNIIDAGYATDASDWSGFDDYKCMISHLAVEHVESFFREIAPHINSAGLVVGGIGVIGTLLGGVLFLVGLPITVGILAALGSASAIWYWITEYGESAVEDLADEIALNHEALACAIYGGDGVSDSIDDFNDEVDSLFSTIEAVAIKAINFEPQLRAMYAGRYDQEDIAENLDDLGYDVTNYFCTCIEETPPPPGYILVNCSYLEMGGWHINCNDNGSFVNPAIGIVTLDFNVTGADWSHVAKLKGQGSGGTGWLVHGWVVDFISYTGSSPNPSYRGAGSSFPDPIDIGDEINPGTSWGGFNRYNHGTDPDFEDWASQYDYYYNANHGGEQTKSVLRRSIGGISSNHVVVYRLRILVPE